MLSPYYEDFLPAPISVQNERALVLFRAEMTPSRKSNYHSANSSDLFRWLNERYEGFNLMPRGKKNVQVQPAGNANRNTPVRWHNVKLEDTDIPAIEEFSQDETRVASGWLSLALREFNVGFKRQDDGKSYMAYLIGYSDDDQGVSVGVSAYGSDAFSAIASLVFKYYVLLGEHLPTPTPQEQRRFG